MRRSRSCLPAMATFLEPDDGLIGIGSGGAYALAAARALVDIDELSAEEVAKRSMAIAADICVFTNSNLTLEVIDLSKD